MKRRCLLTLLVPLALYWGARLNAQEPSPATVAIETAPIEKVLDDFAKRFEELAKKLTPKSEAEQSIRKAFQFSTTPTASERIARIMAISTYASQGQFQVDLLKLKLRVLKELAHRQSKQKKEFDQLALDQEALLAEVKAYAEALDEIRINDKHFSKLESLKKAQNQIAADVISVASWMEEIASQSTQVLLGYGGGIWPRSHDKIVTPSRAQAAESLESVQMLETALNKANDRVACRGALLEFVARQSKIVPAMKSVREIMGRAEDHFEAIVLLANLEVQQLDAYLIQKRESEKERQKNNP